MEFLLTYFDQDFLLFTSKRNYLIMPPKKNAGAKASGKSNEKSAGKSTDDKC